MSVTNKKKQLQTRATVRKINARNGPKPADSQWYMQLTVRPHFNLTLETTQSSGCRFPLKWNDQIRSYACCIGSLWKLHNTCFKFFNADFSDWDGKKIGTRYSDRHTTCSKCMSNKTEIQRSAVIFYHFHHKCTASNDWLNTLFPTSVTKIQDLFTTYGQFPDFSGPGRFLFNLSGLFGPAGTLLPHNDSKRN